MNTPPIVSAQEWEAAHQRLLVKEKELTRAHDALAALRRRMPWLAVDQDVRVRRTRRHGESAGAVRRPASADRLSRLLRARHRRLARPRLPRLLDDRRPHRQPRPSQRPRHHAGVRLARAAAGHRAAEGADGLADAVVHDHRQLRRSTSAWTNGTAPTRSSMTATGCSAPTSSTTAATRCWDHLELPGHDGAGAPGNLGGLAGGLPAEPRRTSGGTGTTTYGEHEPSRWFGEPDPNDPNDQRPPRG